MKMIKLVLSVKS